MVKPEIVGDTLHLHVEGADKVFALKSQLSIPFEHINGVRVDAEIVSGWWGLTVSCATPFIPACYFQCLALLSRSARFLPISELFY